MKEIESDNLLDNDNQILPFIHKKEKIKNSSNQFSTIFLIIVSLILSISIIISLLYYFFILKKKITEVKTIKTDFNKSFLDNNKYELIKLNNEIEVLIIQDIETIKSSFSVVVNTGFLSNPKEQGIAHLTMNYIFNENNEEEKQLIKKLKQYFGNTSSKISRFFTSYNFYCLNDGFYGILKKFGEIFSQKINESPTRKDVNYLIKKINDIYLNLNNNYQNKEEHLINYIVEGIKDNDKEILPEGNEKVLEEKKLNIQIKNYIKNHYFGKNIKIALYSPFKPSLVKSYVIEAFNNITENSNNMTKINQTSLNTNKIILTEIMNSLPFLKIVYYINGTTNGNDNIYINQGYFNYIDYILTNSKNSLYHIFDTNSQIKSIDTYSNITINNKIKYTIQINFYDVLFLRDGKNIENMINYIFSFIDKNIVENFYDTSYDFLQDAYNNSFLFKSKSSDFENYANLQALKLFWRGQNLSYFLYDSFLPEKSKEKIKNITSQFLRENAIVILGLEKNSIMECGSNFLNQTICLHLKINKTFTEYFPLKYSYYNVDFNKLKKKEVDYLNTTKPDSYTTQYKNLISPNILDKNEFISKNNIHLIYNSDTMKIYSKIDRTFKIPKVVVNIKIFHYLLRNSSFINLTNPYENLFTYLTYYHYLKSEIEKELRDAIIAGNEINVGINDNCIFVEIVAFSDIIDDILIVVQDIIFKPNREKSNIETYIKSTEFYINETKFDNYWKYKIKPNYYIKKKIKINLNSIIDNIIKSINEVRESMIVYVYFYGNINDTMALFLSQFFSMNDNSTFLPMKLADYYGDPNISNYMVLIKKTVFPSENYSIYYINKEDTYMTVQVIINLGKYTEENYLKLFLISKLLTVNNDVKIELKILKNLFFFIEKISDSENYQNLEKSIDNLFTDKHIDDIKSIYQKKNNETGIDLFYYLKNNLVLELNKKDLNLNDRANEIFNSLFYDNIELNSTSFNYSSNKYNIKDLKKYDIDGLFIFFKDLLKKNFIKLTFRIGQKTNEVMDIFKSTIFNNQYQSKPEEIN